MRQLEEITVPCEHCSGSGRVALPRYLKEALAALDLGYDTAPAIHRYLGRPISAGTINNRLELLRHHGLVTRRRVDGIWVYRAVERTD